MNTIVIPLLSHLSWKSFGKDKKIWKNRNRKEKKIWYNKGITITFIETTKGYKFGGYTELPWDKSNSCKKDKSTFIFSFNNKQKYTPRNNNDSIGCYEKCGPRFGNTNYQEIYFYESLNRGQSYDGDNCTFIRNRLLTNGEEYWDVKEVEFHKINYLNYSN